MTIKDIIKSGEDFCKMIFDFSLQPRFSKSDAYFINSLGADVSSIINRIASVDAEYESKFDLFNDDQIEELKKKYRDFSSVKDSEKHFLFVHPDNKTYSTIEIFERTDLGDLLVWTGHINDIPQDQYPFSQLYAAEVEDIIPYKGEIK